MAEVKISALAELTAIADGDYLPIVDISEALDVDKTKRTLWSNIKSLLTTWLTTFSGYITTTGGIHVGGTSDPGTDNLVVDGTSTLTGGVIWDGWQPAGTWTYASATTITVPAGAAAIYSVGDKIKLTQTTVKYFYIITVADTLLTVTGGSDYTVADAAITNNYYSKASSPVGFPGRFQWNPTEAWTAGTAPINPSVNNCFFSIVGKVCTVNAFRSGYTAGATCTVLTFDLPVTPSPTTYQSAYGMINVTNTPNPTHALVTTQAQLVCTSVSANRFSYMSSYSI